MRRSLIFPKAPLSGFFLPAPDQNVTRLPIRDDTSPGFSGGGKGDGSADERWELSRLEVLRDPDQKRLTTEAARLLGVMRGRAYETSISRRGP